MTEADRGHDAATAGAGNSARAVRTIVSIAIALFFVQIHAARPD